MNRVKPTLFIASSTPALPIAEAAKALLTDDAEVTIWKDSRVFPPGTFPLDALKDICDKSDFGLFVVSPDDRLDTGAAVPRDNVVFEAGLFMGQLGRLRTFFLFDPKEYVKQPSDWKGVTGLEYSHGEFLANPDKALESAMNTVRDRISNLPVLPQISVLKSLVQLIGPGFSPAHSFSKILSENLPAIEQELTHLKDNKNWSVLKQVKIRVNEFFEYSGQYRVGVKCGKLFASALAEAGEQSEADWTRVKLVAYLSILAGQPEEHDFGREELESVLNEVAKRKDDGAKLLRFYCHRYRGISYQRDIVPNKREARKEFEEAQRAIDSMRPGKPKTSAQARLNANLGNLDLDERKYASALALYHESLEKFEAIKDVEHVAIAHLQVGQTLIASRGDLHAAAEHLSQADEVVLRLGHVELQGRVAEQRALLQEQKAAQSEDSSTKRERWEFALDYAKQAKSLFGQIESDKRLGAAQALVERLELLLDQRAAVDAAAISGVPTNS